MSQVEHRAERSFAIKGTLVFTHIWSAMEKKLQGFIQRYRSNIVKLRFWMQAGNL